MSHPPTSCRNTTWKHLCCLLLIPFMCQPGFAAGVEDWSPYGKQSPDDAQKAKAAENRAKTAESRAKAAERRAAELEQRLKEAEKSAAEAGKVKVPAAASTNPPASPPAAASLQPLANTPSYAPLSVFRDKLKSGGEGPAMVVIPASTKEFAMGSNDGNSFPDEKPIHPVSIRQSFALGRTEVTQKEWRQVMGSDPPELRFKGCDDCPVENVSWNDAQSYIRKLNEQTGKTYRLPSEAEWEYACRAGKANETYCGDNKVDAVAWYDKNSNSKTHPVAGKSPNAWGLHDMNGNVREWVEDWYHDSYSGAPADGSAWVTGGEQKYRVLRGGSWNFYPRDARSASRGINPPVSRSYAIGFRVAQTLP